MERVMRLQFSALGFILLMLGVLFIYFRIPVLDIAGVLLFFVGLLLPMLHRTARSDVQQAKGSYQPLGLQRNPTKPQSTEVDASQVAEKLEEAAFMIGLDHGYIQLGKDRGDLSIDRWIELSRNEEPKIRRMACLRGFYNIREHDLEMLDMHKRDEMMARLKEMEEDPKEFDDVRDAARKTRLHLEKRERTNGSGHGETVVR